MPSNPAAVVHQELRTRCAPFHTALEDLLDLQSDRLNVARYLEILTAFQSYYTALDQQLRAVGVDKFDAGQKLVWLDDDLAHFGQVSVREATVVPTLQTEADAYGALYVIEGAALGGQYIAKHLHQQLGLTDSGNHFFSSHGINVPARWKEFRNALGTFVGEDRSKLETVVQSAVGIFATLHIHFEQHLTAEANA